MGKRVEMSGTPKANGKTVLVTGATNGIGKYTALELAKQGFQVVITARDQAKGQRTLEEIVQATGNERLELMVGDLSSLHEQKRLAAEFKSRFSNLDVLVNNAGGIFQTRQTTVDGLEYTFAFNHMAYFTVTQDLLEMLKAAPSARIVSVSSSVHYNGKVNFEDLQFERGYASFKAYSQSKLLNVLHTLELSRRLKGTSVTANALHPGVVGTGFGHNFTGPMRTLFGWFHHFALTPEQGAKTSIYLASSAEVEGQTGLYFDNCKAKKAANVAYDHAAQDRLWRLSEALLEGI
jgi:NAD(P)-dependent dehydrogenase (short-subunit alcohol dehydrogenase family)